MVSMWNFLNQDGNTSRGIQTCTQRQSMCRHWEVDSKTQLWAWVLRHLLQGCSCFLFIFLHSNKNLLATLLFQTDTCTLIGQSACSRHSHLNFKLHFKCWFAFPIQVVFTFHQNVPLTQSWVTGDRWFNQWCSHNDCVPDVCVHAECCRQRVAHDSVATSQKQLTRAFDNFLLAHACCSTSV